MEKFSNTTKKFNITDWQDKTGHKRTLGQIGEGVSNYIHIEKTITLKDIKGKTVTLRKGDKGTHKRIGSSDIITVAGNEFDSKEWNKKVEREDFSVS